MILELVINLFVSLLRVIIIHSIFSKQKNEWEIITKFEINIRKELSWFNGIQYC